MVSLKDIKKRIQSIESIEKITRAMKMVASAKLRKALTKVQQSKPYAIKIEELLNDILCTIPHESLHKIPILNKNNNINIDIIVLTSNRGLCGSFNNNVIKQANRLIAKYEQQDYSISITNIGKKSYKALKKNTNIQITDISKIAFENTLLCAKELANNIYINYINNTLNQVWVVGTQFKSAATQEVLLQKILPLDIFSKDKKILNFDYVYEPSTDVILDHLIKDYFTVVIHQKILESIASEHAARSKAMEDATQSAKDTSNLLTLQYNRARQSSITRELMEIISGAEALK